MYYNQYIIHCFLNRSHILKYLVMGNFLPGFKPKLLEFTGVWNKQIFTILFFSALMLVSCIQLKAQDPIITVRFANPEYLSATQTYTLDVEFKSDQANKQLFGMNVRFFYPDNVLEYASFGEFAQGYAIVNPNPPIITTGNETGGMILFGFPGPHEYLNGAIQKVSSSSVVLSTTDWTKIFNVTFNVDDTAAFLNGSNCPSVIWDLNEAATGGIAAGLCMTVVLGSGSSSATERCEQFNWQYDGIAGLPHGFPVNEVCSFAYLRDVTVPSGLSTCEDAVQTIFVAGDTSEFIVESGSDVTLIAGQNILMLPGTVINSGSQFLAAITTNGNYCGSLQSALVANPINEEEEILPDLNGQSFKVYPNPTTGRFTLVRNENMEDGHNYLQVVGMLGNQILYKELDQSGQFDFDLTGQQAGIYFIRLISGDQAETIKLIKQ